MPTKDSHEAHSPVTRDLLPGSWKPRVACFSICLRLSPIFPELLPELSFVSRIISFQSSPPNTTLNVEQRDGAQVRNTGTAMACDCL